VDSLSKVVNFVSVCPEEESLYLDVDDFKEHLHNMFARTPDNLKNM